MIVSSGGAEMRRTPLTSVAEGVELGDVRGATESSGQVG
jgi:hypothetical protein